MIWNKSRECMSRDELADLQGKRLVKLVKHMYHNAGYYKKKMQKLGIEPGDIRGIEDLNKLPFTTKEDLLDAYPLGVFAAPGSKIVRYHASNNIGEMGTVTGYTKNDLDIWGECVARSIGMAGFDKSDVIQIALRYDMFSNGLGAHYGAERFGAAVIPAAAGDTIELVIMMRRLQVTGIMSTPSYLMRVAQTVEQRGMKNNLRLKKAICGGESWPDKARKKVEEKLGIQIYDICGLNELIGIGVAGECECQNGMHVQEDYFVPEILDMYTLKAADDGAYGELVFTTLQKEGIPLIRYRTKCITSINYSKCDCGRTTARIVRICDGSEDIVIIRGIVVYMFRLEAALSEIQDSDVSYVMCIRREHNLDVVDVYIENDGIKEEQTSDREISLKRKVANAFCNVIGLIPNVYFAGHDMHRASKGKKVTVLDERKYY